MKNTFKLSIFFHSVYKTNIDCFLFGAQFKIIGPRWCQNHDYTLASGIVMVLTSPQAYNFNYAPQSSQYLYNNSQGGRTGLPKFKFLANFPIGLHMI